MSKAQRVALYELPEVQALLKMFADGDMAELTPEVHPALGAKYPKLEQVVGDAEKARSLIDQLVQAKIVHPKFYEKIVICPKCGSKNVGYRYYCTYCGANQIDKRNLYEHIECGAIDSDDHFVKGQATACSRCGKPVNLASKDVRQVGSWFECRNCTKRFVAPEGQHYCRDCSTKFSVKEGVLDDVYSYVLDKEAQGEYGREVLFLAPLKSILKEGGYEIEPSPTLQGVSGTSHTFDLVASKKEGKKKTLITLDVALSEKICGEDNVINVFAKSFDISPTKSFLITVPALNDTGKKLANMYKLEVIEGEKADQIAAVFRETLQKIS